MKYLFSTIAIITLVFLYHNHAAAQKYKRLHIYGGMSLQVLVERITDKPDDLENIEQEQFNVLQFNKQSSYFTIVALKLNKKNDLEGFGTHSTPNELIAYYSTLNEELVSEGYYYIIDTLNPGFLEKKYPFVDLYFVESFYNPYGGCRYTKSYSSVIERLLITDKYLYLLEIQRVDPCMGEHLSPKTTRILRRDFKQFCRSVRFEEN